MKLIIAGSRDIHLSIKELDEYISNANIKVEEIEEVICGLAPGVDMSGEKWARYNAISIKYFPADWEEYGRQAVPIRNREMAKYGDVALVVHNGSKGSLNMIWQMRKLKKQIYEIDKS